MNLEVEQIKCYAQVYLYIFTEGNAAQIADFIAKNLNIELNDYHDIHKVLVNSPMFLCTKRGNGGSMFKLNI